MNSLTDEQLAAAHLKGDKRALEVLIRRYLTPIFNYALSFVKDEAMAEDITQDAFVKVWKKIKKFDDRYKFKNWLYAVAKNTCLDYLKKNKAINFSDLNLGDDNLLFEELIRETTASPQIEMEVLEDTQLVNAAIDKLPEKYKETVKLRYQGGYKFREIAKILKVSIETIKSRNRRALIYLKKLFDRNK